MFAQVTIPEPVAVGSFVGAAILKGALFVTVVVGSYFAFLIVRNALRWAVHAVGADVRAPSYNHEGARLREQDRLERGYVYAWNGDADVNPGYEVEWDDYGRPWVRSEGFRGEIDRDEMFGR